MAVRTFLHGAIAQTAADIARLQILNQDAIFVERIQVGEDSTWRDYIRSDQRKTSTVLVSARVDEALAFYSGAAPINGSGSFCWLVKLLGASTVSPDSTNTQRQEIHLLKVRAAPEIVLASEGFKRLAF